MWKRLQHPRIVRQPSYDELVLAYQESMLEKSYGGAGDHLGLIAEQGQRLEQHQHQQYGYGSKYEERPRREDVGLKGLPRLPLSEAFNDAEDSSINKMPDISQLGLNQASPSSKPPRSIPVMRREKRAQVAAAAANLSSRKQAGDAPRGRLGNESSITGGRSPKTHTSLGDHVRRLQSTNSSGKERPEWKGATGRTTLVSPVQDQHHKPPISMPRKNNLLNSTREGTPGTIVRTSSAETSPDPRTRTSTSPVNPTPDLVGAPQSAATKTVARNAGEDRPGDQGMERDEGTMAQIEHTFERGVREALPDVSEEKENKDEDEHEYQQPSSRFSVTTYTPHTLCARAPPHEHRAEHPAKDSVLDTMEVRRKREEEKRKVEALRAEEADVRREEHEIGLKLHRAWRRKEREDGEGGSLTGLWVRRVTR
ncbi:hypothetical protein BUE80_DR011553 [Diplocarpon rosae]|nr:hypothetical protein BUE80_DR011553 [Diplocarpon rosae]